MPKSAAINLRCAGCDILLKKVKCKKEHVKNENEANNFSLFLKSLFRERQGGSQ